ncbi:MAG: hypothetical protein B6245_01205 [Desulfobacteraceae bacterium 4572_88]|nr:MAG: hypothetical protein B6245_01205 [Desulfobacteraceae bacterium 4572_88]
MEGFPEFKVQGNIFKTSDIFNMKAFYIHCMFLTLSKSDNACAFPISLKLITLMINTIIQEGQQIFARTAVSLGFRLSEGFFRPEIALKPPCYCLNR